jgi:hypothetical protein
MQTPRQDGEPRTSSRIAPRPGTRRSAVAALATAALALALAPSAPAQGPTPTGLQLSPSPGALTASWEVSNAGGLSGFHLRWSALSGKGGGRVDLRRGVRSYTISELRHVPYLVRVRALYNGEPAGTEAVEGTPLPSLEEPPEEEIPGEEPPEEEAPEEPGEEGGESEEEPTGEEAPGEEVPHGALVSATPTGPPVPSGGWSVVYADGFGAPLGNGPGQDNTWFPNNCTRTVNCSGFNTNEMEVMNPSAVSVTAAGLKLTCTHTSTAQLPGEKHYVCGTMRAQTEAKPAGYRYFKWSPGKGQTLVFQAVAKFPPNTGEADPGWWSNGPPWNGTEVDFFEGGGASPEHTIGWSTDPLYTAWFATPHPWATKRGFSADPSLAFHTYTFEIKPDNTYSIWIDGQLQPWATNVGPAKPDLTEKATLILSYALRQCGCTSGFKSGTREFDVRSVSVYEDKAHDGVGIENGGLAPGTTIG